MKIAAIAVAVVCFVLSALYFTGHGPAATHKVHPTHGIVFLALGLLSLVWLRFQTASAEPR